MMNKFSEALLKGNIELIKTFPKSDLHNHASLGSRLSDFEAWAATTLPKVPEKMTRLEDMDQYLIEVLAPLLLNRAGFEYSIKGAFEQAVEDGVSHLGMSIDSFFAGVFDTIEQFTQAIEAIYQSSANQIQYLPELGINRAMNADAIENKILPILETGYFKAIDLYGVEVENDFLKFKDVYRFAENHNIKRKAHCGEFLGAESIRKTVDALQLQEVQHGITAVQSTEVMNWLQRNNIQLNICPTSNVRLGRVDSLAKHPARMLADRGIPITINSDDIMIFDQSVSEEYLNLFNAGVFSGEELDLIRQQGMGC